MTAATGDLRCVVKSPQEPRPRVFVGTGRASGVAEGAGGAPRR